jgi:hypothetical protein
MSAKKKRRYWEPKDNRILRECARRKVPAARIARKLRRTPGAVRQYAHAIGLSLDTRTAA